MSCSFFTRLLPNRHRRNRHQQGNGLLPQTSSPINPTSMNSILRPVNSGMDDLSAARNTNGVVVFDSTTMSTTQTTASPVNPRPAKKMKLEHDTNQAPTCKICFTAIDGPYSVPCRHCKSYRCYECLRRQMQCAITDREQLPARCCAKVLHPDVAKGILDPAELIVYKQRYNETTTPNPFYCPVPTCSAFIPKQELKVHDGKVTCYLCSGVACMKCKAIAEDDHVCSETTEVDAIVKSFNYKLCPKCSTGVMRMYGCPHIRCHCGAHWCWDCQRPTNACYRKPCSQARAEGEYSDGYETPGREESDDEERVSIATPALEERSGQQQMTEPVPPAGATEQSRIDPTSAIVVIPNDSTQSLPLSNASLQQLTNLDDPDWRSWEVEPLDFGEEPADEAWDLWGCQHNFHKVIKEAIPENWMLGIDLNKDFEVECMQCFKATTVFSPETADDAPESEGRNQAISIMPEDVSADKVDEIPEQQANRTYEEKKVRQRKKAKESAYDCRHCGVIYCYRCKRSAHRLVAKYADERD